MDDFTSPYEPETVTDDIENHKRTILHFDIDCFYAQVSKYSLTVRAMVQFNVNKIGCNRTRN